MTSDTLDVLGGWAGLWQGAIGSAIGSLLGVVGAFLLSVHTIRRQLEGERLLARERRGVDVADGLVVILAEYLPILSAAETQTLLLTVSNVDDDAEDLSGILEANHELAERVLPLVEEFVREVHGGARYLPGGLAEQCFTVARLLPKPGVRKGLQPHFFSRGTRTKEVVALRVSLDEYRVDPLAWLKRERRAERRRARRQRLRRFGRLRHEG